ncbi:hypothetical protein V1279_007594 [Bradyrhizobium sp. AZCC 1610]|uniref:PGN_0703 family putative restriction endonuclease n=1 Tax=Bradyrhizobium sp. AZCC 1610 TaxID=3117020 RepID=UPI002FF1EBF6
MQTSPIAFTSAAHLPRVPLVPDELLRRNNVFFEIDTRFRRAARLLQCLWLKDRGIPTGHHVRGDGDDAITMELHSYLSPDAARAGLNFLSPEIHAFVRRELLMREEGAAIDEDRLFGNALSSMPLVFNLFGPMALDLNLATAALRQLLPGFVHQVTGFIFEHSPGRRQDRFLNDGTAFDLAIRVITTDGEEGTIFVEQKYSEDMTGPAARLRDRYDEASRAAGLFADPDSPMLRSLALEQLWREHMLAQLAVDQGLTPRAMFIAIGPRLNRRVMAAFRVYENELISADDQDANRVPFQAFTLEAFIDALAEAGAEGIARELWGRYADFERVYHLSLGEYLEAPPSPAVIAPLATASARNTTALVRGTTTRTTAAKRTTESKLQKVQEGVSE